METWTEKRMEELLPVAAELLKRYTGGASTSVTYEKAQELMEAVLYCIREYEQEYRSDYAPAGPYRLSAEESYRKGFELVVRKVKKMRAFYNRISERFCSYGCRNYEDVMQKGMPEFFRRYDPRFAPQKTILTLDYPTLLPPKGAAGIDAIEQYLSGISLEQRFLAAFEEQEVCRILSAFDWNYREQFYNLCAVVLQNVIGCVLMAKPPREPACPEHLERLEQWQSGRSRENIQEELCALLKRLVEERFQGNELLYEYLCGGIPDLAVRMKASPKAVFSWM